MLFLSVELEKMLGTAPFTAVPKHRIVHAACFENASARRRQGALLVCVLGRAVNKSGAGCAQLGALLVLLSSKQPRVQHVHAARAQISEKRASHKMRK
jgi:hypothetical protein